MKRANYILKDDIVIDDIRYEKGTEIRVVDYGNRMIILNTRDVSTVRGKKMDELLDKVTQITDIDRIKIKGVDE